MEEVHARHTGPYQLVLRRYTGGKPRYYVRFRDDFGELRGWVSTGLTSKTAARTWAMQKWKAGTYVPQPSITFGQYAEEWWTPEHAYVSAKAARGKPLTMTYCNNQRAILLKYILPTFAEKKLAKITTGMIETWLMSLTRSFSITHVTANHVLRCLKKMFAEALRRETISSDPASRVAPLQEERKRRAVLTIKEVATLFNESTIDSIWNGDGRAYTAALLGVTCGLRVGEIQALTRADFREGFVVVSHSWERKYGMKLPKNGDTRQVPLPAKTEKYVALLIESLDDSAEDDLLFPGSEEGRPLDHRYLADTLKGALMAMGIPESERVARGLTFHSLRHAFNSIMRGRIPDHILRALTGHRTVEMTDYYSHIGKDELKVIASAQKELF